MPNDSVSAKKTFFYGVSQEEQMKAHEQRTSREQDVARLLRSARTIREDDTNMREIEAPLLNKIRQNLERIFHATKTMAKLSVVLSLYFAFIQPMGSVLIEEIKDAKERRRYARLTEEEKRLKDQQLERQRYDGRTWDELTLREKEYYIQKGREDIARQQKALDDGEVTREYLTGMFKNIAYSWAPTIFMLFLCLGYKKRKDKHEQAAADAANFMLDWAEKGSSYAINPKMLKNIMSDRFARDVISGMSEAESIWFELLLEGNVEIAKTPEFKNMAIAVMRGYLEHHPEAILQILEQYDRDTVNELMPGYTLPRRSYSM